MARMNLRDLPDDVYRTLVTGTAGNRQSLNSFVVERLTEIARVVRAAEYVASYQLPHGTGVTMDAAVAAVREVREAS